METLKDLWASLVAGMRERTTNPLTVAFIISWCLWNYKFFVVILGDDPTTQRLKALEEMYPLIRETYMGGALLYPALSALIYVFIYPLIGMLAIWVYRKYQVTTANLVKKAEKARTITPQERDALVRAHEKERKRLTEENDALSTQLTAIRATLDATVEQLEKARSVQPIPEARIENSVEETALTSPASQNVIDISKAISSESDDTLDVSTLDETKLHLLLQLSTFTSRVSLDVLAGNLNLNPTVANSELRALANAGLVVRDKYGNWGLTENGETLAVKMLKKSQSR